MPITPDQINGSKLPTALRGYQREATDELLKKVAWDFGQLTRDCRAAGDEISQLQARVIELESGLARVQERFAGDRAEFEASVERRLQEQTQTLEAEAKQLRASVEEHRRREELTRSLLENAQRTAREMRESTRADCDALIKAARRRGAQIERGAHEAVRHSSGELARLQRLERDLKEQLRHTLEAVIGDDAARANGGGDAAGEVPAPTGYAGVKLPAPFPAN